MPATGVPIVGASGTVVPTPVSGIDTGLVVAPLKVRVAILGPVVVGLNTTVTLHVPLAASDAPAHVAVRVKEAASIPPKTSLIADVLPLPELLTTIVRGALDVVTGFGPKLTVVGIAESTP